MQCSYHFEYIECASHEGNKVKVIGSHPLKWSIILGLYTALSCKLFLYKKSKVIRGTAWVRDCQLDCYLSVAEEKGSRDWTQTHQQELSAGTCGWIMVPVLQKIPTKGIKQRTWSSSLYRYILLRKMIEIGSSMTTAGYEYVCLGISAGQNDKSFPSDFGKIGKGRRQAGTHALPFPYHHLNSYDNVTLGIRVHLL